MDFLLWVKETSDKELANGDFVTLSRTIHGFITEECLQTFSGIKIHRKRPTYACYATTERESYEDSCEGDEDAF
jgi:hypothetical protein